MSYAPNPTTFGQVSFFFFCLPSFKATEKVENNQIIAAL